MFVSYQAENQTLGPLTYSCVYSAFFSFFPIELGVVIMGNGYGSPLVGALSQQEVHEGRDMVRGIEVWEPFSNALIASQETSSNGIAAQLCRTIPS